MILFNCKKTLILLLLFRSGTIRLSIVSRILSWIFEGDGITLQMEGYFSVLLFSILLCHIGFFCFVFFLHFVFFIIFVTEVFERPSGEGSP